MTTLTVKSSDVRSKWAQFVDEVIHNEPKFVQRNERDIFLSLNLDVASVVLEHLRYKVILAHDEEANEYIASSDNTWIVESGESEEAAVRAYLTSYIEWAVDYYTEFNLNYNSPNLKPQFPYILKALVLDDVDKLRKYTDVEYNRS